MKHFDFPITIFFLVAIIILCGCGHTDNAQSDGNTTPTPQVEDLESYYVNWGQPVDPEYPPSGGGVYYFIQNDKENEERNIYVCGYIPELKYTQVRLFTTGGTLINSVTITNGKNYYFMGVHYTAPLKARLVDGAAGYRLKLCDKDGNPYTIEGNDVSNGVTMQPIANRDFNIKYSYQTGCDLLDNIISYQFQDRTEHAFNGSNTKVYLPCECSNLETSVVQYENDGMYLYVYYNISTSFQGISRLISAYDIQTKDENGNIILPNNDTSIVGITQMTRHVDPNTQKIVFDHGESFTFHHRATLYHSGDELKKEITRAAIHEIGHLRGRETDLLHTDHNGGNKSCCVMYLPTGGISNEVYLKILNNPVFCEGHNQILFNKKE